LQSLINGGVAAGAIGYVGLYVANGASLTGATSGVYIGPLTVGAAYVASAFYVANQSLAGTIYGINAGTLTSTSASAYGISIGNIASATGSSAYGIQLGTVAGGASSGTAYGIYMGAVTASAGANTFSFYSAGSAAVMHNGAAVRIGGGDIPNAAYAIASTLTITSAQGTVTATNAYAVKGTGAAGLVQAIWIKVYAGTTAYYVPAWATV